MLDFFPFLAYLPAFLQPWRKLATSSRVREQNLHRAFLRRQPETGNAPQCFGSLLVQIQEEEGISDDRACDILAMLIGAGADTTSSYLQSYKVMAIHPQTMKKAQEELGNIAGSQRLPTWDDEMPLPYVRALIKVHRWAPIGSLGSPYATTKRDVYEGRHIPEGDVVSPNLTAFSRSPE
ncbi:cytochrome P450 [Trematosphaeria pertusa]|uniref:Cytochrome P450 n=1 Tax=Trematosphaeria pertusa TaxID=390896 RepID=A0A6A6IDY8_9PLEO|nr:cytochrome P450 [Trematosphaeria pertusa]KAF2248794.1 cytochrome P450 [Trematosphaeria pertusa]